MMDELIDYKRLNEAYNCGNFYSLQLEIGDFCYQGCLYCYMNALPQSKNTLSDDDIHNIITTAGRLGISTVEWLGGEPLLRDSVFEHMETCIQLGIRNNVWTGGLPLRSQEIRKKVAKLARNGMIAFHISSIDKKTYRILHPQRPDSDLDEIINAVRELIACGYPPEKVLNSVTFTGLQSAGDMIATIDYFAEELGIRTSLNIYHTYLRPDLDSSVLDQFIPSRSSVEQVYKRYAKQWKMTAYPMNCVNKQYCSATIAILCDGSVTPCATIRPEDAMNIHSDGTLEEIIAVNRGELTFSLFRNRENLPPECRECPQTDQCFGCRSRAYAAGKGIYGRDPRCFHYHDT
ncbi:MAG: radical SAM protein [Candidatus Cloacimonetes bacterium]|nr:radical SAM protein [Candidatus Cloacimonadota bacterium]